MIEKGIPIPPRGDHGPGRTHPAHSMEVGDSILFPTENKAAQAQCHLIRTGKKGAVRKVEGGWRVWRTA